MHPWQQPANFTPTPAPCNSTGTVLVDAVMLDTIAPNVQEEFLFHIDDIIMQRNDVTALYSNLEEQWMMASMPDCMCTDNYWHDHGFTHVGNANAEDECSLDLWANFMEVPSQSQTLINDASSSACRSMSPAYFSCDTSGNNLADLNTTFAQSSPVCSEASSSFAAYQHDSHAPYFNNHVNEHVDIYPCSHSSSTNSMCTSILPSLFSGETLGTCLANTNTSFIHPSPVYSEASVVNQHDPLYMSDHTTDNMGIHHSATSSVSASILPDFVHGNVPMTYSGSATSNIAKCNDNFFDSEASYFVAFASPPPNELNLPVAEANRLTLNLEVRASRPQLNLEAGASSPLHAASCHSANTAGAIINPSAGKTTQSGEGVSILVESSTPAIEDGYVWRKYGQKSIKDRVHPRGYFRCAHPNCSVKKQTESSSDKRGFVLITYFGRHNH